MHDLKNFYIAWVSSVPLLAAIESETVIKAVSAIVLPVVLFAIGKTADIVLQLWLHRRGRMKKDESEL